MQIIRVISLSSLALPGPLSPYYFNGHPYNSRQPGLQSYHLLKEGVISQVSTSERPGDNPL